MQPTIPQEGHVMYYQSTCEVELEDVYLHGLRAFFMRASDAPEFKGPGHKQLSLNNVTWSASNDPSHDYINQFGGYVQFKLWPQPFVQFQPQGYVGGKILMLNSTVNVHVSGGFEFITEV